ncbi:MAG: monooxygenase [Calditrichaeota bacterium]|nr:MAG: monooxygenase [Calditrichota bacterium]
MALPSKKSKIIIIGAGPIGLEAALYALQAGYDVEVLEKGDIADHIRQWGHVRLFSPFYMNHTSLGRQVVESEGRQLPDNQAYLTGREFVDTYLTPLAKSSLLEPHIRTQTEVLAVGRRHILKNEHIGNGHRRKEPFKLLIKKANGEEEYLHADIVIDCTGSYSQPNWLGDGGIPAIGELENRKRIQYWLVDIAGASRNQYLGKTTLLVGGGHSAANTIVAFHSLFQEEPSTRLIWVTRQEGTAPLTPIPEDPLIERDRVVREANALSQHPNVNWLKGTFVEAIQFDETRQQFRVSLRKSGSLQTVTVDHIIANVGYSPDNRLYQELQVHECYASRAPMKLAAALLSEGSSTDCLTQSSKGAEVLKNPEPNFYVLGMKSYGKNTNFLMRVGHEQIRDVFQLITGDDKLDLYEKAEESEKAKVKAKA